MCRITLTICSLLALHLWLHTTLAQAASTDDFTSPPANYAEGKFNEPNGPLTYKLGDSVDIEWETVFESSNLFVVHAGDFAGSSFLIRDNITTPKVTWRVQTAFSNLTLPFVFRVTNADGNEAARKGGGFLSWYVTLVDPNKRPEATSTSIAQTSSSVVRSEISTQASSEATTLAENNVSPMLSMTKTSPLVSTSATSIDSNTSAASGNTALSSETKLGLGLGVSLGFVILLSACACFFLWWRKKHAVSATVMDRATHPAYNYQYPAPPYPGASIYNQPQENKLAPAELPASVAELQPGRMSHHGAHEIR